LLAQLRLHDLAGEVARDFVDEDDLVEICQLVILPSKSANVVASLRALPLAAARR